MLLLGVGHILTHVFMIVNSYHLNTHVFGEIEGTVEVVLL